MKANSSVRDCLVAIENLGVFEIHGVENYVSGNQIQAIWLHVIAPFGSIRLQFLLFGWMYLGSQFVRFMCCDKWRNQNSNILASELQLHRQFFVATSSVIGHLHTENQYAVFPSTPVIWNNEFPVTGNHRDKCIVHLSSTGYVHFLNHQGIPYLPFLWSLPLRNHNI